MSVLAFIISIAALTVACLAYQRSGGSVEEVKKKVEELGLNMETLRLKTADILNNIEKKIRGEDKPGGEPPQDNA